MSNWYKNVYDSDDLAGLKSVALEGQLDRAKLLEAVRDAERDTIGGDCIGERIKEIVQDEIAIMDDDRVQELLNCDAGPEYRDPVHFEKKFSYASWGETEEEYDRAYARYRLECWGLRQDVFEGRYLVEEALEQEEEKVFEELEELSTWGLWEIYCSHYRTDTTVRDLEEL